MKLIKLTSDWEEEFEDEAALLEVLEKNICKFCTIKVSELPDGLDFFEYDLVLPDDYDFMSIEDKISELLNTSCGCEFMVE
jgi:hypothetical protein